MSYRASRFMVDAMNLLAFTLNRLFFATNYIYIGSIIVKRDPLPNSLSTDMEPPCASTNSLEIASPNPLPCTLVPGMRK